MMDSGITIIVVPLFGCNKMLNIIYLAFAISS